MNSDSIPDAQRLLAALSDPVRRGEVTPLDAVHVLLKERDADIMAQHLEAINSAILELIRKAHHS